MEPTAQSVPKKNGKLKWLLGALAGIVLLGAIGSSLNKTPSATQSQVANPSSSTLGVISASTKPVDLVTNELKEASPSPSLAPTPLLSPKLALPKPIASTTSDTNSGLSNDNYYKNSSGNEVHSPAYSNSAPQGATAVCGDGTYSFSQSRRGTCSHHGGVSQWL